MYDLKRRMQLSSVIPLVLLTIYFLKVITLNPSAQRPPNQVLIADSLWFILSLVTLYLLSVIFFSLENLIKAYITDSDSPESTSFKNQFETASIRDKTKVLFRYDTVVQNKITHSVILQLALVVFTLFAMTNSYSIIGYGLGLSILLQMLVDQIHLLRKNKDVSSWFWQIKTTITQDIQNIYVLVMGVAFIILMALIIR